MITNDTIKEKELLQLVASGDERAFTELFDTWSPFLAGYLFRLTESRELTQEIIQDVFLKIWQNRQTLPGINNIKAFLFIVSRNQAYHAIRSVMREEKQFDQYKKQYLTSTEDPETNEYYSILDEAINQLPPRRKEVYLLSRHNRMTYEEIARSLGISRESVKTHISLATASIVSYVKSSFPGLTSLTIIALKNFF